MRLCVLLLAAGMLCTVAAHADDIFNVTSGANTVSFTLPSTTTPMLSNSMAFQFVGVTIDVNGVTLQNAAVDFYTAADGGGLEIVDLDPFVLNLGGAQVFGGTTADPIFSSGQFSLDSMFGPDGYGSTDVGITTDAADAVAPEPASIALLGTGLLGVAGTLRRRLV